MKTRPINKNNTKNIYCGHCEHFKMKSLFRDTCANPDSKKYNTDVHYWNRCKCFEWRKDEDYAE